MSFWGHFMLRNCDNDLVMDLSDYWFFPSELKQVRIIASRIGVKLVGNGKNRGTTHGDPL